MLGRPGIAEPGGTAAGVDEKTGPVRRSTATLYLLSAVGPLEAK